MSEVLRDMGGGEGRGGGGGGGRGATSEATSADSLLPIVSSQRERFKQRNTELEAVRREGRGERREEQEWEKGE